MTVLITGGCGFLGVQLAGHLLATEPAVEVVLFDRQPPPPAAQALGPRLRTVVGDLLDVADLDAALAGVDAVVHLASVVSADAEADPGRAWSVNVEGLRTVLDGCQRRAAGLPFVFASSVAVFAASTEAVGDGTKHRPRSTYGMTKAIGELLVEEATRRGAIDGRCARLPTVIIRPGRPNLAASSFASGVFREPLAGTDITLPVGLDTPLVVIGHRAAVSGLARLLRLPGEQLGDARGVGLPGLGVTVAEMVAAARSAAARHGRSIGAIDVVPDAAVGSIVASWPAAWDNSRATELGLQADVSLDEIVDAYLADFG